MGRLRGTFEFRAAHRIHASQASFGTPAFFHIVQANPDMALDAVCMLLLI
jgi:hypothetical protein